MNTLALLCASAFRLIWVDPYGEKPYLPDSDPPGGVETNVLSAAAARGEIESLSFVVVPGSDLPQVDFRPSALQGPDGVSIPASAADFAQVKVWYRAGGRWWNSWAGAVDKPELINEMILHDDTLVKVDETEKVNYLRGDYPSGTVYMNMSRRGRDSRFDHSLHPVRDTQKFVPFDLKKNRRQQYWLTWKVPSNAKSGIYRGRLSVLSAGKPIADIPLELEVYPFELPYARTHYDTSREYVSYWMGVPSLAGLLKGSKRLDVAEAKLRAIARSLVEHNVHNPSGPGEFMSDSTDDLSVRSLIIFRQEGMACRELINGRSYPPKWVFRSPGVEQPTPEKNPELFKECLAEYREYFNRQVAVMDKYLGHHNCLFCSVDECGTGLNVGLYPFWEIVHSGGCGTWTDSAVAKDVAWNITGNAAAAICSPYEAWKWHRAGARVFTYAGPFTGPVCPDVWRRTKGLRYYYADYDGLDEYEFYCDRYNRWNDSVAHDSYCQFGIVHLTYDGLISTISWEGVREALDDVRYLSLLRMRAEAALMSKDPATVALGKREIKWMDSVDPESVFDLFSFRREVVARIKRLVSKVGPQPPDPSPILPAPELPAMTYGKGRKITMALAREFEKNNRYDLAMDAFAKLYADKELPVKERLDSLLALARMQSELRMRDAAVKTLDDAIKSGGFSLARRNKLKLAKVRAILSEEVFEEQIALDKLQAAEKTARPIIERKDVDGSDRAQVVDSILKGYYEGGYYAEAIRFGTESLKSGKFIKRDVSMFNFMIAQSHMELGQWQKALKAFKRVHPGMGGDGASKRRVYEREVIAAEKCEDWLYATELWGELAKCYDVVEEQRKIQYAKKRAQQAGEKRGKMKAHNSSGEFNELDGEPGLELEL